MNMVETLNPETCWDAIERRDKTADGAFVYAVASTGVYCRPSCSSRQPRRDNVRFFPLPAAAEREGYRPCKRCRPRNTQISEPRAKVVQAVAEHLETHVDDTCETALGMLGARFGYDPQHIQRMFKEVLGLTPKQYADGLRVREFKRRLRTGSTVLDAGLNAGYGSASRTYENGGRALGMSPAAYKKGAEGVAIRYTAQQTSLGVMLVAATEKGICSVGLYGSMDDAKRALVEEFPHADISKDSALCDTVEHILSHIETGAALNVTLDIRATAFQQRVWRALMDIPRGETRSYADIAQTIGDPKAVRAVANACSANPTAILIPCHRVVHSDGRITGYKWGTERKQEMLAAERGGD